MTTKYKTNGHPALDELPTTGEAFVLLEWSPRTDR